MMGLLFLLIWSLVFIAIGWAVWSQVSAHIKVYYILVLHLVFLTGVFFFYPIVIGLGTNS